MVIIMKKNICCLLILSLLFTVLFTKTYAFENIEEISFIKAKPFAILGTEYNNNIGVIVNDSQLEYKLCINELSFYGNSIHIMGIIQYHDEIVATIHDTGLLYKSSAEKLKKANGITALFSNNENLEIVSCTFEQNADIAELLPVNKLLSGNAVIKIVIRADNALFYFEGQFPLDGHYNYIFNSAPEASCEKEIVPELRKGNSDVDISEKEAIQLCENWKHSMLVCYKETEILENESNISFTKASSPLPGVPVNVFMQEGSWASVNNPNNPHMGYYAVTYSVPGTNNYVTNIIKWEYFYNPCNNFPSGVNYSSEGKTGIKILAAAEYTYYAIRDSIEFTNSFIPYRIKNARVEMGLSSDEQILTSVNRVIQANGSTISVNWASILGLLPWGQLYTSIITMFSAVEYHNHYITTSSDAFQATASAQLAVYGKLIRDHKLTDNGYYFIKNNDRIIIEFNVASPGDLTRTCRQNTIGNQYYFEIYARNPLTLSYSDFVYSVDQTRSSYYTVY